MKPGIPIQIGGILVDLLSAQSDEGALGAVPVVQTGAEVPVALIEALIHLKLKSPRPKDAADVIELLKAGIDCAVSRLARREPRTRRRSGRSSRIWSIAPSGRASDQHVSGPRASRAGARLAELNVSRRPRRRTGRCC